MQQNNKGLALARINLRDCNKFSLRFFAPKRERNDSKWEEIISESSISVFINLSLHRLLFEFLYNIPIHKEGAYNGNYYFLKNFDQLWGKGEEGGEGSKGTIHALHFIPLPTSAQCRTVQ